MRTPDSIAEKEQRTASEDGRQLFGLHSPSGGLKDWKQLGIVKNYDGRQSVKSRKPNVPPRTVGYNSGDQSG